MGNIWMLGRDEEGQEQTDRKREQMEKPQEMDWEWQLMKMSYRQEQTDRKRELMKRRERMEIVNTNELQLLDRRWELIKELRQMFDVPEPQLWKRIWILEIREMLSELEEHEYSAIEYELEKPEDLREKWELEQLEDLGMKWKAEHQLENRRKLIRKLRQTVDGLEQKSRGINLLMELRQTLDELRQTLDGHFKMTKLKKLNEESLKSIPEVVKEIDIQFENKKYVFSLSFLASLASAVKRLHSLESVTLTEVNIGKQQLDSLVLSYEELLEIADLIEKREEKKKAQLVKVCIRIFVSVTQKKHIKALGREDFEIECNNGDSFADSIILNLIANELTGVHEEVASTIPSTIVGGGEPTLVCIVKSEIQLHEFRGFPVKTTPISFLSKASIMAESSIDRNHEKYRSVVVNNIADINEVISHHTESLLSEHSNIEAIKASFVKQGQSSTVANCPCVVIYCRVKGAVPYKEKLFPRELHHPKKTITYPTDIREGFFSYCSGATDWHKELAMGCSIGEKGKDVSGTVGPFVNVVETNELCFLTAKHIFPPLYSRPAKDVIRAEVVQPADFHLLPAPTTYTDRDRECGEVVACVLDNEIDAALVKIKADRKPKRGLFVDIAQGNLQSAGLNAKSIPAFDTGEIMSVSDLTKPENVCQPILKIGVTTGLTKGLLNTTKGVVTESKEFITLQTTYRGRTERHCMIGQLMIDSLSENVFCQKGDSGAAVFLLDSNSVLNCIGIVIGILSDCTVVVTPIEKVMQGLGNNYGKKTVEMQRFKYVNMDTSETV